MATTQVHPPGKSVPLVVRVKRSADEEPLDVIRLLPPPSKIARGSNSSFSLQNLEFKHAGTIDDNENLSSKTVELIDAKRPRVESKEYSEENVEFKDNETKVEIVETSSDLQREGEVKNAQPATTLRRNRRMYAISKAFRPVSTADLDEVLDPWTRFFTREDLYGIKSSTKRKLEDVATGMEETETASKKSFILCDLESYGEKGSHPSSKKSHEQYLPSNITCNDELLLEAFETSKGPEYVYDIYTFNPSSVDAATTNGSLYDGVCDVMSNLDYILGTSSGTDFWNEVEVESENQNNMEEEDEDSNDEDNWRNDYPEEVDDEDDTSSNGTSGSEPQSSDEGLEFDPCGREDDMYGLEHSYASRRRKTHVSESEGSETDSEEDE